jgi:hypothetical protein
MTHHYDHANTRTGVSQTPGSFLITLRLSSASGTDSEYSHPVAPTVLWNFLFTVLFIQLFHHSPDGGHHLAAPQPAGRPVYIR